MKESERMDIYLENTLGELRKKKKEVESIEDFDTRQKAKNSLIESIGNIRDEVVRMREEAELILEEVDR